jgi:signal transduction histidine kinase/ligand-binding sensor domain-containing protein
MKKMKKLTSKKQKYTILFLSVFFLLACNNVGKAPPFPELNSEFAQPLTKKFEFSKIDTIQWVTADNSKSEPITTKKFNWNNIPSKPFNIDIPYKLKAPLTTKPLDWNNLPKTNFSFDSLPKAKINIKVTKLGSPKIVKAGNPITIPNASRGIMEFNTDFGLPGTPYSVITDNSGMIWIGTDGGIAKYDSQNLEIYTVEQGLNSNRATVIYLDSKGRLWIGNDTKTISVIDFQAQLVYELSSQLDIIGNQFYMIEDNDGNMWMNNQGAGYLIIDLAKRTIWQFSDKEGLLANFSITAFQDKESLIWLSTGKGVNIIDLKNKTNRTLTPQNGLFQPFVFNIFQDTKDKIWIGTGGGGVQIINANKTKIAQLTVEQGLTEGIGVSNIYQDKSGKIWLGSNTGFLYAYDETNKLLEEYEVKKGRPILHNILEDRQGQIWAGDYRGGLYKLDYKTGRPGNYGINDGLTSNEVWGTLKTTNGNTWIGTYNGIDVYDPKTQTIKHLGVEQGLVHARNSRLIEDSKGRIWACGSGFGISIIDPKKETIQQLTTKQGLKTDNILAVFEDDNGVFWIGGSLGEIQTVDLEHSIFKYYEATTEETKVINNIMLSDASNNIWLGTTGAGIQIINPKNNTRKWLTKAEGLVSNRVYTLMLDTHQNIWAGTQDGVQNINQKKNEITTFTTNEGLGANDVYALIEHNGEIFSGTSKGLSILKPTQQAPDKQPYWTVKTIDRRQGLNEVDFSENSFSYDNNGRLWAGVNGIMLTVMDSLQNANYNNTTYITGLNILDKKQEFKDEVLLQKSRQAIDTLGVINKDSIVVVKNDIENSKNHMQWKTVEGPHNMPVGLTLPATQNYLSFNYNGLQLNNPDKLVYSYFLEGIDRNWSPVSNNPISENYRDLPSGDYNFKVVSKGLDGSWSKPAEFKFTILSPWWQTWWAYLIYFILLVLAGFQFHRFQKESTIRKEREKTREKELAQAKEIQKAYLELKATQSQLIQAEKMASLGELTAGIAHEIQNPLNFVNNFSEVSFELMDEMIEDIDKNDLTEVKNIAEDIKQNLNKINFHGKRADAIVKGMLQHSRTSTGIKEPTDVNALADEYLRLAYHGLRAKDKSFNATMKTDFDDSIGKINIIPQDMGRVILNLITNAFYVVTEKKKLQQAQGDNNYEPTVWVSTKKVGNKVIIMVKDNGNGIPKRVLDKIFQPFFTTKPTGEGTGLGLSLSYDIVKVHGGELKVETKENEGTKFTIQLS